jgi:hypothetical protein
MKSNKYLFRKKTKKINKTKKRKQRGGEPVTHTYPSDNEYGYSTYTGEWANEQPEGKGQMTFANGDKYIGEWRNGKRNGKGIMRDTKYNSVNIYNGEWKDDKKEGYGTKKYDVKRPEDLYFYIGEWKNDKENGRGKHIWANGDYFDTEWIDGFSSKKGILKMTLPGNTGKVYEGEVTNFDFDDWRKDLPNGKGKFSSPNFTYEGDFVNGDPNGIGKITTPYLTYDGEFANGRMTNGNGKMIYPDGTVYDGEFKNGRIVWKNDVDCENNAEIEDPISLEQIPTGSGFRLSTELLPNESVGRCYDVNNLVRIRDNISPLYRKPFTDLDRERIKAYKDSIGEPVGGKTRKTKKARKTYKKSRRLHK